MIRIVKPAAPKVLTTRGTAEAQKLTAQFQTNPTAFRMKITFRKSVYAAKSVKAALVRAQHGKCAFCESEFLHVGYGDVEHFRPKAACRQSATDKLKRPGYFWLAYAWDNLLFSCQLCNQKFKRNLFPLREPKRRCRNPSGNIHRERPLLVHPEHDEPSGFLRFVGETVKGRRGGGATRGRITIDTFGLNRDELRGKRMKVLERLRTMRQIRDELTARLATAALPDPVDVRHHTTLTQLLNEACHESAEYAAMARAFLR